MRQLPALRTSTARCRGLCVRLPSALLLTLLTAASVPALAEEAAQPTISVSATGTAHVAPDMAVLNLAVQREAKTARKALDANNMAMAEVLAAMRKAGIADRDLQTSNFNIQPRYHYPKSSSGGQRPLRIVGYVVHNGLTVRVRKLVELGAILDQSVSLGVNSGGAVTFTTDKPEPIIEQARKSAVERAIAKARTLTAAAGVKLGRILEISESSRRTPQPRPMARMESAMARDQAVPIASGENSYSVSVNVRWALIQ